MKADLLDRIFMFDQEKTIEVILYITRKLKETQTDYMRIAKLMYFADKTHLEDWGRTITLDSYVARYHGNFGKHALRILMGDEPRPDGAFNINYTRIIPLREPDMDFMSESDIRVLDSTLEAYNQFPNWHLVMLSRDQAWANAYKGLGEGNAMVLTDKYGRFSPVHIRDIVREVDNLEGYLVEHLEDTGHPHQEDAVNN